MSKPVNIVLEKYDNEELAEANELIGDLLINANIENKRLKAENAKLRKLVKNALAYIEYEGCGVECHETGNRATFTSCETCNRYETESCAYVIAQSAREMGIEVEDA